MTRPLHDILTAITLDLTTHVVHLKPILAHWHRIGGATPGARLDKVYAGLKTLRATFDLLEQQAREAGVIARAALQERDDARRELDALRALAFVNRSTTAVEGLL